MSHDYDILIAGGGLVGGSLALALARTGWRIGVIEPVPPQAETQPSYDDRSTALAPSSRGFFQALGVWEAVRAGAEPIKHIHVSEQGGFGFMRMHAEQTGDEALGHVAPNRVLGAALMPALEKTEAVDMISPAGVKAVAWQPDRVIVTVDAAGESRQLSARLLVAADGARSRIRAWAGIDHRETDYHQTAVIANLTPQRHHRGWAYERFTRRGPIALLPLRDGHVALVWTLPRDQVDEVLALDDAAFLQRLQSHVGHRLGRLLKVGERASYPLTMITARQVDGPRLVVVGNAAHALHPVAGQGLNLALRDVAELAERLQRVADQQGDPGDADALHAYAGARKADYRRVATFTDITVRSFSNALPGLRLLRNIGLLGLDLGLGKSQFMRIAMGRVGPLSRLARGLPLLSSARKESGEHGA